METHSNGLVALWVLTLVHFVPATMLFVIRRERFPMKGHSLGLVLVAAVSLSLQVFVSTNVLFGADVCFQFWIVIALMVVTGTTLMARCWRTWFFYSFAEEKMEAAPTTDRDHDQLRWCAKRRRHFTTRRLMVYTGVISGVWSLASAIPYMVHPEGVFATYDFESCTEFKAATIMLQVYVGLAIIVLAYTVFKLRKTKDGYYLRLDCIVSAVSFASMLVFTPFANASDTRIGTTIAFNVMMFAMVTAKVMASFRSTTAQYDDLRRRKTVRNIAGGHARSRSVSSAFAGTGTGTPLDQLLEIPELRDHFAEHLKSEFSAENLVFYEQTLSFEERCNAGTWSTDVRNRRAMSIYTDFIASGGDFQVNLPCKMVKTITHELSLCIQDISLKSFRRSKRVKSLNPAPADVFAEANKSIYGLMWRDTLVRFKVKMLHAGQEMTVVKQQPIVDASTSEPERNCKVDIDDPQDV